MSLLAPEAALAALQADPEVFSPLDEQPILVVDAGAPGASRVAERGRHLPCVLVGVAADLRRVPAEIGAAGFDILLTDEPGAPRPWVSAPGGLDAALDVLRTVVATRPFASVALVQLLRLSCQGDIRDAVVAESFAYSALQAGPEFAAWLDDHRRRRAARVHQRSAPPSRVDPSAPPASSAQTVPSAHPAQPIQPAQPAVLVEREGSVLTVVLNRPGRHNAVNTDLRDGLVAAFRLAALDDALTAIRLAGAGPSFSSGGDLTEFGSLPDPGRAHAVRTSRSIPLNLLASGVPATAYVHGLCIGAGAELPAFCTRVVAAPDATFRLPEIAMGLVPGAGGTASLPRRVGRHRAAHLILSGQPIGADQALAWGLVDAIEPRHGMPAADI
ncbi:enoyl-CoA hydratase/isomerase family protein [Frankia sp. R82]|uniref:enoyl-CoA hydratase/isomerase family protein n=1 Tax=Frankia sp. R82 TaxID=2950553 RepID=UPI0020435A88|nr:enoyl-CoA hydratase/isomerase family protein [Frankia sp. R82]MCM3886719.1 enoyl-CoA hydratase/isomerase family protein [Frankia sp. R82]